MKHQTYEQTLERLQNRTTVDPETGCWHYTGANAGDGYGHLSYLGKLVYAHRLSAAFFLGFDLGSVLWVLHRCDEPDCINPEHLFIGTPKDNVRDAVSKGRMSGKKLTLDDVIEIKRLLATGETQRRIAGKYGVSTTAIGQIARGETWKTASPGRLEAEELPTSMSASAEPAVTNQSGSAPVTPEPPTQG